MSKCESPKVKKNGVKGNGRQNFYCKDCHKQFQFGYQYRGRRPTYQIPIMAMRASGIRDIANILKISVVTVILTLRLWFKHHKEPEFTGVYEQVIIDEFWSWVGHRKEGKRWVWYACCTTFG